MYDPNIPVTLGNTSCKLKPFALDSGSTKDSRVLAHIGEVVHGVLVEITGNCEVVVIGYEEELVAIILKEGEVTVVGGLVISQDPNISDEEEATVAEKLILFDDADEWNNVEIRFAGRFVVPGESEKSLVVSARVVAVIDIEVEIPKPGQFAKGLATSCTGLHGNGKSPSNTAKIPSEFWQNWAVPPTKALFAHTNRPVLIENKVDTLLTVLFPTSSMELTPAGTDTTRFKLSKSIPLAILKAAAISQDVSRPPPILMKPCGAT